MDPRLIAQLPDHIKQSMRSAYHEGQRTPRAEDDTDQYADSLACIVADTLAELVRIATQPPTP